MEQLDQSKDFATFHSEESGKKIRKRIWIIFWVLLIVTSLEVTLGLVWKSLGLSWQLVKLTFIFLTILKAFYIVSEYMHLKHEKKVLKNLIIVPFTIFVLYLCYILFVEGLYTQLFQNFFFK